MVLMLNMDTAMNFSILTELHVYFTSDVDAKSRISSLNYFYRINLNDVRRAGAHDDGVFNECKISDQNLMMILLLLIRKTMVMMLMMMMMMMLMMMMLMMTMIKY